MGQGMASLGLVVLLLFGKAPGQKFGPFPDIEDETFIKAYIDAHNKYRSEVNPSATNMRYMTFDIGLARIAKKYGKKCIWDHNPKRKTHPDPKFRPFGENMWIGGASKGKFDISGPIRSFYQEVKYYDLGSNKCTHVCGHYTQPPRVALRVRQHTSLIIIIYILNQASATKAHGPPPTPMPSPLPELEVKHKVVWANSYKVGCAVVFCRFVGKKKNIVLVVCDYGPPGNYVGARPYKAGRSCNECGKGDTCQNNLCRNPERDKANTSYANWYPPYELELKCDASCIAVAILRPLLMFVVFIVVYFLKLRYPGLNFKI